MARLDSLGRDRDARTMRAFVQSVRRAEQDTCALTSADFNAVEDWASLLDRMYLEMMFLFIHLANVRCAFNPVRYCVQKNLNLSGSESLPREIEDYDRVLTGTDLW